MTMVKESREVRDFEEIYIEVTGELTVSQGDIEELIIETDHNLMPHLKSEVVNGRLELGLRNWFDFIHLVGNPTIRYAVTVKRLRGIKLSGSGKINLNPLVTDRLRLKLSGSGEIHGIGLQSGDLELEISGSGKADLTGAVTRQELEISGSGEIQAESLESQETRVHISGSGNIRLRVQNKLQVAISGSGQVRYHGQPAIDQRISGSGSIRPI